MTEDTKFASAFSAIQKLANNMRTDVVALWRDKQPGEKRGTYSPRRDSADNFTPLTSIDLHNHLAGHKPIGLYVFPADIGPHGLIRTAIVDFDDKEKRLSWPQLCQQAAVVSDELKKLGLKPWPCRSGSGHGVHLWVTWAMPQSAGAVRILLRQIIDKAKLSCHVDLFPTSDQLRYDGETLELGSLVALPCARMSRPIVNLDTGECVEDLNSIFNGPEDSDPIRMTSALDTAALERDAGKGGITTESYGPVDLDTLAEALSYIDTDDYEIWRDVGMALKHGVSNNQLNEADAEKLWTDWASKDSKYDQRGQDYNWRRFRPNGTLQIATIWYKAKEGGWKPARETRTPTIATVTKNFDAGAKPLWHNDNEVPDYVAQLNKDHFLAAEGGKATVFKEEWDPVLSRHKLTRLNPMDFRLLQSNIKIVVGHSKKGVPIIEKLGDAWLDSEYRRQYSKIALMPEGADHSTYNLWRGWTVEPSEEGSCEIFKEHLFNNVCVGDREAFEYLWNWCALTMQRPHQPIGTAIVMRGDRGTGKSTFARIIGELFGQHFLQVTSSRDLTGRFNAHLRDCILLFADEAVWAGSKSEESTLKGLITEPYLSIEGKGRDLYQCRNMLHLIIATNSEWSVPAGLDERRFMAIHVGNAQQQNTSYFKKLWHELNTGGKARLLWELLNHNISGFDPFKIPQTKELTKQKLLSLDAHNEWWHEKLDNGAVLPTMSWDEPMPIQALYLDYVQHCRLTGQRAPKSVNYLGSKLRQMLPAEPQVTRSRLQHDMEFGISKLVAGTVQTMWKLPNLQECRDFFDKKARAQINWTVTGSEPPVKKPDEEIAF
jgi:hypothetical protein